MKVLLACEGPSEVSLIRSLLYKGQLAIEGDILLDEPLHLRQLKEIAPVIHGLPIHEDILIYRIGDTLNEEMSLKGFEMRKDHIEIQRICTKREIEILIIINEGLYGEYQKQASTERPKTFLKKSIDSLDLDEYFASHDMIPAILEYKRVKKHRKGEGYLADLLNVRK